MWLHLSSKIARPQTRGWPSGKPLRPQWSSDHTLRTAILCVFMCPHSKLSFYNGTALLLGQGLVKFYLFIARLLSLYNATLNLKFILLLFHFQNHMKYSL